jgi:membrane fusion protein
MGPCTGRVMQMQLLQTAFDTDHRLALGMLLRADIVLEERSLATWLMEPVLAVRGRL